MFHSGGSTGEYSGRFTFGGNSGVEQLLDEREAQARFTDLYREAYRPVRRYLVRMVGIDDADDLTATVFVTVWERWRAIPAEPGKQFAWVFTVAHFKVQEAIRSRERKRKLLDRMKGHRVEDSVGSPEEFAGAQEQVSQILALLPDGERAAVELTVLGGLSSRQAAQVLGCSVSAVTSRVSRARARLTELLSAETGGRR